VRDEASYYRIAGEKSGSFFALAAFAGAHCAVSDRRILARFRAFGRNVGMLVQLADDLADLRAQELGGDLRRGHHTLPVLYALRVATPTEGVQLEHWLMQAAAGDLVAAEHARELVLSLGGELYVRAQVERYRQRASFCLEQLGSETTGSLLAWLVGLGHGNRHNGVTDNASLAQGRPN
jgi:octaprenyl-diphosphate synthase